MARHRKRRKAWQVAALERLYGAIPTIVGRRDSTAHAEFLRALDDYGLAHGVRPSATRRRVERANEAKEQARRATPFFTLLGEIVSRQPVIAGDSLAADVGEFLKLRQHAESLWDDAVLLFLHRRYARAAGVAISCIEELGKVAVARIQVLLRQFQRQQDIRPLQMTAGAPNSHPPSKSPLYSHPQKHILAAGAGALVNSRLDRILGLDHVAEFLDDVERKKVEPFRQSCYYADRDAGGLLLPGRITRKDAEFYVVLAGELLAELAGTPPDFERVLRRVQRFERSIRHRWR
jgi:AbiV family abortive infection protein